MHGRFIRKKPEPFGSGFCVDHPHSSRRLEESVDEVVDGVGCALHAVLGSFLGVVLRLLGSLLSSGSSFGGSLLGSGSSFGSSLLGGSSGFGGGLLSSGSGFGSSFLCRLGSFLASLSSRVNLSADGSTDAARCVERGVYDWLGVATDLSSRLFQSILNFTSGPLCRVDCTVVVLLRSISDASHDFFRLSSGSVGLATDFIGNLTTLLLRIVNVHLQNFAASSACTICGADGIVDRLLRSSSCSANRFRQFLRNSSRRASRISWSRSLLDLLNCPLCSFLRSVDDIRRLRPPVGRVSWTTDRHSRWLAAKLGQCWLSHCG